MPSELNPAELAAAEALEHAYLDGAFDPAAHDTDEGISLAARAVVAAVQPLIEAEMLDEIAMLISNETALDRDRVVVRLRERAANRRLAAAHKWTSGTDMTDFDYVAFDDLLESAADGWAKTRSAVVLDSVADSIDTDHQGAALRELVTRQMGGLLWGLALLDECAASSYLAEEAAAGVIAATVLEQGDVRSAITVLTAASLDDILRGRVLSAAALSREETR